MYLDAAGRQVIEEIVVFGRNLDLLGSAQSASEGTITGADLLMRPLVKTAELLESMPGMVAVQHSGSGLELTMFWQPIEWLGIDAVATRSRARFTDNLRGAHHWKLRTLPSERDSLIIRQSH